MGHLIGKSLPSKSLHAILNVGIGCLVLSIVAMTLWTAYLFSALDRFDRIREGSAKVKKRNAAFVSRQMEAARHLFFAADVHVPHPSIMEGLVFLGHNDRPDASQGERVLGIGLSGRPERRLVNPGERVYFAAKPEGKVTFSEERTPFWLEAKLGSEGQLEGVFHVNYGTDHPLYVHEEKVELAAEKKVVVKEIEPMMRYLNGVKLYEPDRLLELYGGKTFALKKGRYRMSAGPLKGDVPYISSGDALVWEEGRFVLSTGQTKGKVLFLIRSIDGQRCEGILWSSDGVTSCPMTIAVQKSAPVGLKPTEMFTKLYPRSESSVSCQLGRVTRVLRKGDWLLKQDNQWRVLNNAREIKDVLAYALNGELFIFDGIEKSEGSLMMTGHIFNETRSQVQKIQLPLLVKKGNLPIRKGKK